MPRRKKTSKIVWERAIRNVRFWLEVQPLWTPDSPETAGAEEALSLLAEGGEELEIIEETTSVNRITLIPHTLFQGLDNGESFDRLEVKWPFPPVASLTRLLALSTARNEKAGQGGIDTISFDLPSPIEVHRREEDGTASVKVFGGYNYTVSALFRVTKQGFSAHIGGAVFELIPNQVGYYRRPNAGEGENLVFEAMSLESLQARISARNPRIEGLAWEKLPSPNRLSAEAQKGLEYAEDLREASYPLHTGEEWTALIQSAADGKSRRHYSTDDQSGILRHHAPDSPFYTEATLLEEERSAGFGMELLQNAAAQLDADDSYVWLYVSRLLAPPAPLEPNHYAGGWIDLDDVARKTMGGYARNPKEAAERRAKVWHAILWGARNVVAGRRSVPYVDKLTGEKIPTEINTAPWQIMSRQKPSQLPLFGEAVDQVPVRVELVASRPWTKLTTESDTAQYLPFAEVLGALTPDQPGSAWARILGLAYLNWSRRRLHQALEGVELPSREELLSAFPSKVAPYQLILNGNDPRRALLYWQTAEILLKESQIIETSATLYIPTMRKNWQSLWLSQSPDWKPGARLRPVLEGLGSHVFPKKIKALTTKKLSKKPTF